MRIYRSHPHCRPNTFGHAMKFLLVMTLIGMGASSHVAAASMDDIESSPSRDSGGQARGGFSFGIDLTCLFTGCNKDLPDETGDAAPLAKSGPKLPGKYAMNGFTLQALVKGGAPYIVDCEARDATLKIEIKTQDKATFVYNLKINGRTENIFRLPESFSTDPKPATISIRAVKNQPGAEVPASLRIYAMGMGEKAVGSVAIDQLSFGPPEIRIGHFGKAQYKFHSRSDFNRVVAEFALIENRNGVIQVVERVNKEDIGQLTRDSWVGREKPRVWNGTNQNGDISEGLHILHVRAWRSSVKEGDWVMSWSPDWVNVKW